MSDIYGMCQLGCIIICTRELNKQVHIIVLELLSFIIYVSNCLLLQNTSVFQYYQYGQVLGGKRRQ